MATDVSQLVQFMNTTVLQEARREAFKFKVHIAREIELRGGVQKRRSCTALTAMSNVFRSNDTLLQHSYVSFRGKRFAVVAQFSLNLVFNAFQFPQTGGGCAALGKKRPLC